MNLISAGISSGLTASEEMAEGMRQDRTKEWVKLLIFKAAQVISQEKATALINDGAECIPLQ